MKRVLAFLLCVVLCVCLAGCGDNESKVKNEEATALLTKVLEKEETFIFRSPGYGTITEENLGKVRFVTPTNAQARFFPVDYTFLDLDSDGVEELFLWDITFHGALVLRYEEGKVYGNYIDDTVFCQSVRTDGSIKLGAGEKRKEICRLTFDRYYCEIEELAYWNDVAQIYQVNGEDTSREAAEAYIAEWEKNTTAVTWTKMEEVWEDMP